MKAESTTDLALAVIPRRSLSKEINAVDSLAFSQLATTTNLRLMLYYFYTSADLEDFLEGWDSELKPVVFFDDATTLTMINLGALSKARYVFKVEK